MDSRLQLNTDPRHVGQCKHVSIEHMLRQLCTYASSAHQTMPYRKKVVVYTKQMKAKTHRKPVLNELWKKSANI